MRLFRFIRENSLFAYTLFMLAFIPLYPKLPLFDIRHTWVYIRLEDFIVGVGVLLLFYHVVKRKASLKTPLTFPIALFWIVGAVATLSAVLFIFPHVPDLFPTLAGLHYVRRIEYLSLFFIAFASIRSKEQIKYVIATITIVLLAVIFYGIGQKVFGFPAFLTMNEEFAKGTPLRLSELARIPSTFAGHYDLAAYLVMMIPVMGSLALAFVKPKFRLLFVGTGVASIILLLLSASRVSYAVYFVSTAIIVTGYLLKKRKILILPFLLTLLLGSIALTSLFPSISQRFLRTFSQVELVVDARSGRTLGVVKEITGDDMKYILIEERQSTGEDLPEGSKYINLSSKPSKKFQAEVTYRRVDTVNGKERVRTTVYSGEYIIKKAVAYDVSFTTRLQGGWPRAITAFQRNIFLGSGYSSISLASDNNYLRILGEVGLLGFGAFILIFITYGIYVRRLISNVDSKVTKYFILGVSFGVFGLALNAIFIDVFEASKIAFTLWILLGTTLGFLTLYQKKPMHYASELKTFFLSAPMVAVGLFVLVMIVFSPILNNYFVGDDFTWFRWIADCPKVMGDEGVIQCEGIGTTVNRFFTDAQGFFYRPGTKLYFFTVYPFFELAPSGYHMVSLILHFLTGFLVFYIARHLLKSKGWAILASAFYLLSSGHAEAVSWISVTGTLVTTVSILLGLYLFVQWKVRKRVWLFVLSIFSLLNAFLFQELSVVGPLLIVWYDILYGERLTVRSAVKRWYLIPVLALVPVFYLLRQVARSLWFQGDYSYSLWDFPLNAIGNSIGYSTLFLFGGRVLESYQTLRSVASSNLLLAAVAAILGGIVLILGYKQLWPKVSAEVKQRLLFLVGFFGISLLPYLGLGNISERYVYLAGVAVAIALAWVSQSIFISYRNQRVIVAVLLLFGAVFFLYHVLELRRVEAHWQKAGDTTKNLMIALHQLFEKSPNLDANTPLYFVQVPIRYGQAWIFPVGLSDAVWLSLPHNTYPMRTVDSLSTAIAQSQGTNAYIFQFETDGRVTTHEMRGEEQ